jgi:hypothetical protein
MPLTETQHSARVSRYQSLSNFYSADRRRTSSREQDVGLWWRVGVHGPTYRAAWVCETGELYVSRLGPLQDGRGEVVVLGRASDRLQLERALDGWRAVCAQPDSMTWLCHRAASLEAAEKPARASGGASVSELRPRGRFRGTLGRAEGRRSSVMPLREPSVAGPTPKSAA